MKKPSENRIFLDTNILMYDFFSRNPYFLPVEQQGEALYNQTFDAMKFIRKQQKVKTYVASFSIPRFVSLLARVRPRIPKSEVIKELERIYSYHIIAGLSQTMLENATSEFKNNDLITDLEDVFQFVVARDSRCFFFLTANVIDFENFVGLDIIHPSEYRNLVV